MVPPHDPQEALKNVQSKEQQGHEMAGAGPKGTRISCSEAVQLDRDNVTTESLERESAGTGSQLGVPERYNVSVEGPEQERECP